MLMHKYFSLPLNCSSHITTTRKVDIKHVLAHDYHDGGLIRDRNCLPFASSWVHPRCLVESVLLIFLVFCVVLWFFLLCLSSSCILCVQLFQCLWIVHSWLPLRFSLRFIFIHNISKKKYYCRNKMSISFIGLSHRGLNRCHRGHAYIPYMVYRSQGLESLS